MFLPFGGCPALGHRGMTGTYPSTRSGSTRAAGPHQRGHAARAAAQPRPKPDRNAKQGSNEEKREPGAGVPPSAVVVKVGATAQDENPSPPDAQTPGQAMTNHATTDPKICRCTQVAAFIMTAGAHEMLFGSSHRQGLFSEADVGMLRDRTRAFGRKRLRNLFMSWDAGFRT